MVIEKLKKTVTEEPFTTFSQNIYPISIFQFDLTNEIDCNEIINDIKDYQKINPYSRTSSIEAWHSSFDTHLLTDKFNKLLSVIESKVTKCINHPRMTAKVFESWAIIYKKGNLTKMHNHGISSMSAVYYAKINSNGAPLQFHNGPTITPLNNSLLVFPGYALHSVPELTEEERIVYTANFTMVPNIYINSKQ